MTELSPQAQAVLDAAFSAYWSAEQEAPNDEGMIAAAALRAAADQVVPEITTPWNSTFTPMISAGELRAKFLAIADELEGGND